MDAATLQTATGCQANIASIYAPCLSDAMARFQINTEPRQSMFLAQVGHESAGLHYTVELWGPTAAQEHYEGSTRLGNTVPGDGYRFRGRGLIQLTGRSNYQACSNALGFDFVRDPDALAEPYYASYSAAWYWASRGLNEVADTGNFEKTTLIINGGLNGQADRLERLAKAKKALQGA